MGSLGRCELINEIVRLCYADGLQPDEKKLREKLIFSPVPDLERILDAFYRFGAREVLCAVE